MWLVQFSKRALCGAAAAVIISGQAGKASADTVTDWNEYAIAAIKGYDGATGTGLTLNSNLGSRVLAIAARAVFDAVNAVSHFSARSYYYRASFSGSAEAAAAQAAHDVLLKQLPDPASDAAADPKWARTRAWLDERLNQDLADLGVDAADQGIKAGQLAATAAVDARRLDNASASAGYGAQLSPATNPGIGLWRQSNAAPGVVDPGTGAPTGFDATGVALGRPAVDLHWRDVTPFALALPQKNLLVASVPPSPAVGSPEYEAEAAYVRERGGNVSSLRTADQTAQALFYRQDAEIFVNEAARIAAEARALTLSQNAALFALLASAVADARIAAFASKYDIKFWRPITVLNADRDGTVTNGFSAWRPVSATPSHPSNTSGHSATGAAGFEVLRSVFGTDDIVPGGASVTLGSLAWLKGTNSGTGNTTAREVRTFSQVQLENGASRLYLGVHFGYDNLQGQLLGVAVVRTVLEQRRDPAALVLRVREASTSLFKLTHTLLSRPEVFGVFGRSTRFDP